MSDGGEILDKLTEFEEAMRPLEGKIPRARWITVYATRLASHIALCTEDELKRVLILHGVQRYIEMQIREMLVP